MTNLIVGVDVSKAYLDLADTRGGAPRRVANESTAIAELIANLRTDAPELVVLEATGGYETALVIALQGAGLAAGKEGGADPRRAHRIAAAVEAAEIV